MTESEDDLVATGILPVISDRLSREARDCPTNLS